jgi:hypothetical protein
MRFLPGIATGYDARTIGVDAEAPGIAGDFENVPKCLMVFIEFDLCRTDSFLL